MSALPPDAPRLRAILRHLEEQLADNETLGVYLRLQRDAVRAALTRAEAAAARTTTENARTGKVATGQVGTGYVIEPKPYPHHPKPALIHRADCTAPRRDTMPVAPEQARLGLRKDAKHIAACEVCAPETPETPKLA
ncbi:DUF6233 domain-containing protein [Streptomyces sp. RY43-2]|uniref:DUF6233 domain-containing protein n=1 Tax=Streptomyces macrolidinus TaxID=2952607 RepID=A0ABT0ZGJ1_9ACTN|nr:DUF6233 domain-containing protein [Streptomyces macrolidinus]MCN9242691.1 DUF6233 domain-containing protein [Streptomyces macrolidinus]